MVAADRDLLMPHCRTAALPRSNLTSSIPPRKAPRLRSAPSQGASNVRNFNISNKSKIKYEKACFVSEFFVPLQCQNEHGRDARLRIKIARIKSRNCAH